MNFYWSLQISITVKAEFEKNVHRLFNDSPSKMYAKGVTYFQMGGFGKMADLKLFNQYVWQAEQLLRVASKEDVVECARLMALNLAHYESKFGQLPADSSLEMKDGDEPNEVQAKLLTDGMEIFNGVLNCVVQEFDQHPPN
ncbi:MAG TPA: hypothetical protein VFF74_06710 [Methylophilaceae bacterium]|nr:hypothetical protein [Methylophilaceae bacterium]